MPDYCTECRWGFAKTKGSGCGMCRPCFRKNERERAFDPATECRNCKGLLDNIGLAEAATGLPALCRKCRRECWHAKPFNPKTQCSNCRWPLKKWGPAKDQGLCRNCFRQQQEHHAPLDSWHDYEIGDHYPVGNLTRSTLFLGNLPHDFDPKAFKTF